MTAQRNERFVPALGWSWLTGLYDPVVRLTTRERVFKQRLLDLAGIDGAKLALDLGCGTGTLAIEAARRHPHLRVVGIDADPQVLDRARDKAARTSVRLELVLSSATALPFPADGFDRVLSTLFFHHLDPDAKRATARDVLRVLRPGGELHLADWGAAANVVMRTAFVPVQLLDGFTNTSENVRGELPIILSSSGFVDVVERGRLATVFGTLAFYSAKKAGPTVP